MEEEQKVSSDHPSDQQMETVTEEQSAAVESSISSVPPVVTEAVVEKVEAVEYAGFWVRFTAAIIDGLILAIPVGIVNAITGDKLGGLAGAVLMWAYAIYMLNTRQATYGKMALGLKVISTNDEQFNIGKLVLREVVGKVLNVITLYIGFIMIAFTAKKQGLHDMIASTAVVYDSTKKRRTWPVVLGVIFISTIPVLLVTAIVSRKMSYEYSDDANQRFLKANYAYAYLYADSNNNSLAGFNISPEIKFEECSGQPIINVSEDNQKAAIFSRSCSNANEYFCVNIDITKKVAEEPVNADIFTENTEFANSGKSECQ